MTKDSHWLNEKVLKLIGAGVIKNNSEIADALGINRSNISNYRSGRVQPSKNFIASFESMYGEKLQTIELKTKFANNSFETNTEDFKVTGPTVLHVPVEAEAGFIGGDLNPVFNRELKEWVVIGFDEPGFSFRVRGESMFPTFKDGEIVITSRIPEQFSQIRKEYVYVVVTNENVLIKRILKQQDGTLQLISDNTGFKQIEVKFDNVKVYRARRNLSWDLSKKYQS